MQTVPDGFMQDSRGRLVPEANVRPSDKLQDDLVRRLHREAGLCPEAWCRKEIGR